MNMELAYITPQVLLWARKTAGYSIPAVVAKLKRKQVTQETVSSWEQGKEKPTYAQFENLAKIYKRPLALFYLPEPPEEEELKEKFRSLPSQYVDELPPSIRFIVRKARVRQLNLEELHSGIAPEDINTLNGLKRVASRERNNVAEIAAESRASLRISIEEQKGWEDEDNALKNWRDRLESLGLWVFKDSFGKEADEYDGFYLPDERFPVIYVNNNKPKSRQIFTIFHEFGHFLLSKGGICFRDNLEQNLEGDFQEEEVFCNAFSGEFLVPSDDFNLAYMLDDEEIRHYAKTYKVSQEVILRRCKEQGLIDWRQYNQRVESWRERFFATGGGESESEGGDYYLNQKAYLGNKYLQLAFSQYYRNRISETQLADYLGIKAGGLHKLEAVMYQGGK